MYAQLAWRTVLAAPLALIAMDARMAIFSIVELVYFHVPLENMQEMMVFVHHASQIVIHV
jgi:hypothetical protein